MENSVDIKELEETIQKLKLEILEKEQIINDLYEKLEEYESNDD